MKSGWIGAITTDVEETIKLGEQFADFIEKGDNGKLLKRVLV